jgi:hypothetical protein
MLLVLAGLFAFGALISSFRLIHRKVISFTLYSVICILAHHGLLS